MSAKPTAYQILEAWIRTWEELLKKPTNLLLNRSFSNIIQPTLVETKGAFTKSKFIERSATGWGRALLELLDRQFRDNNIEIDFFRLEFSHAVQLLEQLLKQGKFDVPAIYPVLEKLRSGPSVAAVFAELGKELTISNVNFDRFVAGSTLILRSGLMNHSVSTLKEKLQVSLSRHGTHVAVRNLLATIVGDDNLVCGVSTAWQSFIDECLSFDLASLKFDPDGGLTKIFPLYSWDIKARYLLEKARECVAKVLKAEKRTVKTDEDRVRTCVTQELSLVLRREYSIRYLCQLLEMPIGGARRESQHLNMIGQMFGNILLSNGFEQKQFRHSPDHRPNPVDACCYDAFVKTIKHIAGYRFTSISKDETELPQIDSNLMAILIEQLWNEESFQAMDWDNSPDAEIEDVCARWVSSIEVQKQFSKTLTPLNDALTIKFRQLLSDSQFVSLRSWIEETNLWQLWHENLSKLASWDRGIFHYIPWESFDESKVQELFARVAGDFNGSSDNWAVILSIHNLKPPENPKRIAGITFYDPMRWDYGEKVSSAAEDANARTSAKVDVVASTFLEAKRIAASQLRDLLNCMALSLSVSEMRGGFKPVIDSEIFAHRIKTGGWSVDRPLVRTDRPITQSFVNFEEFGPMFDFLIHASRSASATLLQEKLLKSLHWYSKAKWEEDPAQSLLFYWIALEHVFDEGNDERLLNLIASLHINWRDVLSYGWYFLGQHQEEVIKQLQADNEMVDLLAVHDDLRDWNKDYRVLLSYQNVQGLLDLITPEKKQLKDYIHGYAEYLNRFVKEKDPILREMESMRDEYRFRLLVIKQIRNDIVHRAIASESNVSLYTDELENIFEDAIVKLTNDAIRQVPQCSSIKDLIAQYEEIWIS
jgi:hypothetical protein